MHEESERRKNIESKAQKMITITGSTFIFITLSLNFTSFNGMYFIFFLFCFYIGSALSLLFAISSAIKMDRYENLDLVGLVAKTHAFEVIDLKKRLIGLYSKFVNQRRRLNNKRAKRIRYSHYTLFVVIPFGILSVLLFIAKI